MKHVLCMVWTVDNEACVVYGPQHVWTVDNEACVVLRIQLLL